MADDTTPMALIDAPTMKVFVLKWFEENWPVPCLFLLMMILGGAHGFAVHYGRAPAEIQWLENMIAGAFAALIAKLK